MALSTQLAQELKTLKTELQTWQDTLRADKKSAQDKQLRQRFALHKRVIQLLDRALEQQEKSPRNEKSFQIFVRHIDGKTLTADASPSSSIQSILEQVEDKTGVPTAEMRVDYGGKPLDPKRKVSDYNIQKESTLNVNLRLKGGFFDNGENPGTHQFLIDVRASTGRGRDRIEKKLKTALEKLYHLVKGSRMSIEYDWVVEQVRGLSKLTAKNVNSLAAGIEDKIAAQKDKDLSGDRGHEFARHVHMTKEDQIQRLEENPRLTQVTRLDMSRRHARAYNDYCVHLSKVVPGLLREEVETVLALLYNAFQEPDYATKGNNRAKRDFLRTTVFDDEFEHEEITDNFSIVFTWALNVGGAGQVQLTCEPEITSLDKFAKIATLRHGDDYLEESERDYVKMYWGSNRLVMTAITGNMSYEDIQAKADDLNFDRLGVTQF